MPGQETPQTGEAQGIPEIVQVDIRLLIAFAGKSQDGVGAGLDPTADEPREMHPEERKLGIGHWINQVAHQVLALSPDFVVLATEGNYAHFAFLPGQLADSVAMQPGTVDKQARWVIS